MDQRQEVGKRVPQRRRLWEKMLRRGAMLGLLMVMAAQPGRATAVEKAEAVLPGQMESAGQGEPGSIQIREPAAVEAAINAMGTAVRMSKIPKVPKIILTSAKVVEGKDNAIQVIWKKNAKVNGYRLYVRKKGKSKWKTWGTYTQEVTKVTAFKLAYEQSYEFQVKGYVKVEEKKYFGEASVVKTRKTSRDRRKEYADYNRKKIKEILMSAKLRDSMTRGEQASRLALAIGNYVKKGYDEKKNSMLGTWQYTYNYWDDSLYYILKNRKGTCGNYAHLTEAVMDRAGIPCELAYGYRFQGDHTFHMWNLVKLDQKWYVLDLSGVKPSTKFLSLDSYIPGNQNYIPSELTLSNTHYLKAVRSDQKSIEVYKRKNQLLIQYAWTDGSGGNGTQFQTIYQGK